MHQHTSLSSAIRSTTIAALFMGSASLAPTVAAQAGNDVPGNDIGPAHPANIHEGTCDDLGDSAYRLFDVTEMEIEVEGNGTPTDEPVNTPEDEDEDGNNTNREDEFATNTIVLDVALDDLRGEDYAIAIQESDEESDTYIACGEITGNVEDDTLLVPLEAMNNSGFSGEAALVANADGQTSVTISLSPIDEAGTPVASPES